MVRQLGDLYALLLGWPFLRRLHKGLFYMSARALGLNNYSSTAVSGEHWVVDHHIAKTGAPVVFDVGANVGDWLADVRRTNADADIHAFEPQATLAAHIGATHRKVKVTNAAVGDVPGFLDLHDYADHPGSQHASLLAGVIDSVHGGSTRLTKVPVVTLDDYCSEHGIPRIDFLKIDVEGYELQVLRGARRMLAEGRVSAIQFEVTYVNILSRVFIDDFVKYLGPQFEFHRLLPHGLLPLLGAGTWLSEQFVFQNILALRKV